MVIGHRKGDVATLHFVDAKIGVIEMLSDGPSGLFETNPQEFLKIGSFEFEFEGGVLDCGLGRED